MEPISALLGLGLSIFGTVGSMNAAGEQNKEQQKQIGLQQQLEGQRHQQMVLNSERQSMEAFRTQQRMRAMGLEAATQQGAAQGSGLQGAYGQVRGQSGVNQLGISQNEQIGENMFGINSQISSNKISMAETQQKSQMYGGISSIGGSIFGASKSLNNIFSGRSNGTPTPNYGYGASPDGNQTGFLT